MTKLTITRCIRSRKCVKSVWSSPRIEAIRIVSLILLLSLLEIKLESNASICIKKKKETSVGKNDQTQEFAQEHQTLKVTLRQLRNRIAQWPTDLFLLLFSSSFVLSTIVTSPWTILVPPRDRRRIEESAHLAYVHHRSTLDLRIIRIIGSRCQRDYLSYTPCLSQ